MKDRGSGSQAQFALRTGDVGAKTVSVAAFDGCCDSDLLEDLGQFDGGHGHHREIVEVAAFGSILRGMDGVCTPFDEEGEDAVTVVGEIDGFPIEDAAIGTFSGAVIRAAKSDLIVAQEFRGGSDIRRVNGPADETRVFHFADLREVYNFLLRGIRRYVFHVTAIAERKQGVARAAAGMDSADGGADAGVLLDELHGEIEVVAAENDVIEQSRHLIFFRGPGYGWGCERGAGEREKDTA